MIALALALTTGGMMKFGTYEISATTKEQSQGTIRRLGMAAAKTMAVLTMATGLFAATTAVEGVTGREAVANAAVEGMNGAEQSWCRWPSRYRLCYRANELGGQALKFAQQVAVQRTWEIHNGGADAVRHCDWSGLMTREFGAETAKGFGDRHEMRPESEQPAGERNMDWHNNQVGRDLASRPGDMGALCLQAADQGKLIGFVPYKW